MRDEAEAEDIAPVVVGVGASAGGLEAFQDLFSRLGPSHDFALVLIQHLDPDHDSLLQELLSKRTKTPVHTITDGMKVEPRNIYLIPPGATVSIKDGTLHLSAFDSPRGQRRPIDTFFESLAEDQGRNAVAIVLSGTGSDGSQGVRAIKEKGGLVFAQDVAQAKYDGMPKSAIATGAVDLSLKTDEMIEVLNDFYQRRSGIEPTIENDDEFVTKVFKHLRYQTGHDFTHYKHATLRRRLSVRMSVLGIIDPGDYVKRLIRDREEAARLFRDVLINVTGFFRDREAFESLKRNVIPELVRDRGRDEEIRVWVPGCSTGQEAYTIGMLFLEELSRTDAHPNVLIFGTDIDDDALRVARNGTYPSTIIDEVPQQYLDEFLIPTADGYEVSKQLRSLVRFSHQSLIKDPPFSKLDLISCRNVTIYFDKKLQEIANSVFHYALKSGGYLLLGMSEHPRDLKTRFSDVDNVNRIYRRDDSASLPLNLPMAPPLRSSKFIRDKSDEASREGRTDSVREEIVGRHMPPFLILDERKVVTYASAGAERFLQLRSGKMKMEVLSVVAPELVQAIRRLIHNASDLAGESQAALYTGEVNGKDTALKIVAESISGGQMAIVFQPIDVDDVSFEAKADVLDASDTAYLEELENELEDAQHTIRTTVEELETSNEELKSSNEEMMSMNEELQSANEELSTINEELQSKVTDLNEVNSDLSSLVESTGLATLFVDNDLEIRRYTPEARQFFRLTESDIGRPLSDISSDLPMHEVIEALKEVIRLGTTEEYDLRTTDGRTEVLLRVVCAEGSKDTRAAVATFIDVTELRRYAHTAETAKRDVQRSLAEIEKVYEVSPIGMALFDRELRYLRVNETLARINGAPVEAHIGRTVHEIVPGVSKSVTGLMRSVLEEEKVIYGEEVRGRTGADPSSERVWLVDFYPVHGDDGPYAIGCNVRDVTEQKQTSEELQRVMRELQHRVKNMLSNVSALVNRAKADTRDPSIVLETLSNRITALSNTHKLLTMSNWRQSRLIDVIKPELLDVYGKETVTHRGPEVLLNARATLALGMVIHELATNAAKYGSLSAEDGKLDIRWIRLDEGDGQILRITWRESGGPSVEPPKSTGFGSTLIRSIVERTLNGSLDLKWHDEGLICSIDIDWEAATQGDPGVDGKIF